MRHARTGKKLGRDSAHRKALYANLTCSLLEHGRIRTTEAKAKAVKPFAEQMITLGRRGDLHARRPSVIICSANGFTAFAFASVVRIRPCSRRLPRPALIAAIRIPANVTMLRARTNVSW